MRPLKPVIVTAIALGSLAVAGCAGPRSAEQLAEARAKDVPEARAVGKPVSCLTLTNIKDQQVYNDYVIDFETRGGKVYRNTIEQGCPGLGFEERFSFQTSISRLCRGEIITVLTTSGPGLQPRGSCGLSDFQPIEYVKKGDGGAAD